MPPQFVAKDSAHAARLMREHPFASLISVDDTGLPYVTHLPLHLQSEIEPMVLLGHVAKPNHHWKMLQANPRAVVTFLGPHDYLSPKVYPDLARVPSWNYVAVHCTVEATLLEGDEAKDKLLKHLIADHEPAYAEQWRGLGEEFAHKMMMGIVAFELKVTSLQCKIKLNQHRPESHVEMRKAYAAGGDDAQELGRWMDLLGMTGPKAA